jgi:hypothetical protein
MIDEKEYRHDSIKAHMEAIEKHKKAINELKVKKH